MSEKQLLTPTEVAKLLLVSPITVRQWAQKGLIESQSTPGGHRRFSLTAVQNFARQRGVSLDPAPQDAEPVSALRILIVEDDVQLRSFLVELFSSREQEVIVATAASGFEAGIKMQTFAPDITLLDLMLPGMDGIEVCKQLKAIDNMNSIRVIAMTGYYCSENVEQILAAGAETCLRKPLDISQLLTACGLG